MRGLAIAVAAGVLFGAGSACLLELDRELACGDGHVDPLVGEECDPGVPTSFEDACRQTSRPDGIAACDPEMCTIIDDRLQCGVCGDGEVDTELGEECDGTNLNGEMCPSGSLGLRCNADCTLDESSCDPCGNGEVEENEGEECDPGAPQGGFGLARACAGTEDAPPLPNLFGKPYASGTTSDCDRTDCRFIRTGCGFCGDGVRDVGEPVDAGEVAAAEWCDGGFFDKDILDEQFGGNPCDGPGQRVNVGCGENCRSFIDRTFIDGCCLEKGAPCPEDGELPRCCYEYDNPGIDPEDACQLFNNGGQLSEVCR